MIVTLPPNAAPKPESVLTSDHNGERSYKFIAAPFCTRHAGTARPDGDTCPGAQGIPYAGSVWQASDPNTADDGDLCTSLTVQNVCADGESLCSDGPSCLACGADGSMAIFTATSDDVYEYLEVENFDAWLQGAGGCNFGGVPDGEGVTMNVFVRDNRLVSSGGGH